MGTSQRRRKARLRRAARVRKTVRGTDARPRLSIYRSNRHLYVQVISDQSGRTLAAATTFGRDSMPSNIENAATLGKEIAEKCRELSIADVVFDRNGFQYHGRVKAVAESAREAGLRL